MSSRWIRIALVTLALLPAPALAQDATEPHLAALLASEAHRAAVIKVATDQAAALPDACPDASFRPTGDIAFFLPPQVDGAGRVVHGLWREQVTAIGCGTIQLLNVFSLVGPTGEPRLLGGLPGTTRADLVMQKDGLAIAIGGLPAAAADCRDTRVVDTALAPDAPQDRRSAWRETWIVLACDKAYPVALRFTPTPEGATIALDAAQP